MNRLSRIVDFDGFHEECLARLKTGDEIGNACSLLSNTSDFSVEEADARWYHTRLGAVLDDSLPPARWMVDWRDRSAPKPTLRLSRDLFAHVAEALERA